MASERKKRIKDRELIERHLAGCKISFEELEKRHRFKIKGLCLQRLHPNDVEDVYQVILLNVWRALPRFEFRSSYSSWVYRVASNAIAELHRNIHRKGGRPSSYESYIEENGEIEGEPTYYDPERIVCHRELLKIVFQKLSVPEKQLFSFINSGCSINETARNLSLTEANTKSRLHRMRVKAMKTACKAQSLSGLLLRAA